MIFRPELAQLIIGSRKTETRRPVKPGVPCRYEEGKHYALQPGRGEKAIDRILVTSVRKETLGAIDHQAAIREGFANFGAFIDYWEALYRREADPDQPVWVIGFELYRPQPKRRVGKDTIRLLTNQHGRKDAGQYTSQRGPAAMPEEPEAIDPDIIERLPATLEAEQRWRMTQWQRNAEYEALPLYVRVARAIEDARAQGVDTGRYERQILGRVKALENRAKKAA